MMNWRSCEKTLQRDKMGEREREKEGRKKERYTHARRKCALHRCVTPLGLRSDENVFPKESAHKSTAPSCRKENDVPNYAPFNARTTDARVRDARKERGEEERERERRIKRGEGGREEEEMTSMTCTQLGVMCAVRLASESRHFRMTRLSRV